MVEKVVELVKTGPLYATICIVVMILAAVALLLFGNPETEQLPMIIGLIVTTIPSLVAALYSERASKDIRNGVVADKAKEGAAAAIQEQQVITRTGPVVTTELAALAELLRRNTSVTEANTEVVQQSLDNENGGEPDGR